MKHRNEPPRDFLRDTDLAARYGVNRVTIWRWTREGQFPKPVRLSDACTRWRIADLERWEQARAQDEA